MRLVVPSGLLALLLLAPAAYATPSARLVYTRSSDAASCADESALRKAVAARFGYDPFFAWARQTVVVQIWRDAGRFVARVQLVDEQGLASGTREIQSDEEDCSEVFGAAALAISIALDASAAQTAPAAPAPGSAPPPPAQPPPEAPPVALPVAGPPPPGLGAPGTDARPDEDAVRAPTEGSPSPFRGGVGAVAAAFIGPNVAPGVSLFGSYRQSAFSLGVELDAEMSVPASQSLPESTPSSGHVTSALFAVAVTPCGHYGKAFACGLGEVGWLQAWGWGVDEGGSSGVPFAGLGGRVGAEIPLGKRVFLRAHADLLANLERAIFQLDGQGGWTVPPVGGAVGLGVGAPLP